MTGEVPSIHESFILDKSAWHARLEQDVAIANTERSPLSVIFFDLDRFKNVNDTLGHEMGDRVLEDVSELTHVLSQSFRGFKDGPDNQPRRPDYVTTQTIETPDVYTNIDLKPGRLGGDEFGVICHTDQAGVMVATARLRKRFDEYLCKPENDHLVRAGLSLSVGYATHLHGMSKAELLREADLAMYADKLEHLPELGWQRELFLKGATWLLALSGVAPRDLPKYVQRSQSSIRLRDLPRYERIC